MQCQPAVWATNFRSALTLLARSAAGMPVGAKEPVLVGLSALELYSGSAWSYGELQMVTDQPRALNAALMAEGFRWADRPRHLTGGLWHPQLQIAAQVVALDLANRSADPTATLTVELSPLDAIAPEWLTLHVVGIEDLITEIASDWTRHADSRVELGCQLEALMELALAGVGGPLREEYLRRRLASGTAGEVDLDPTHPQSWSRQGSKRRMSEYSILAAIHAWRVCGGFTTPTLRQSSCHRNSPSLPRRTPSPRNRTCGESALGDRDVNVLEFAHPPKPRPD